MHRAGEPFRRLKDGARVYYPYEARHLDWYTTPDLPDRRYAGSVAAAISH